MNVLLKSKKNKREIIRSLISYFCSKKTVPDLVMYKFRDRIWEVAWNSKDCCVFKNWCDVFVWLKINEKIDFWLDYYVFSTHENCYFPLCIFVHYKIEVIVHE